MRQEGIIRLNGKSYEYSRTSRVLHIFVFLPIFTAIFVFSTYLVLGIVESSRDGLAGIIGILFSGTIIFGVVFNYLHIGTIVVNDWEITSFRKIGFVSIPWKEIDVIYYKIGSGKQDPQDPYFAVYIFSRDNNFITLNRGFDGIKELMDTIRQRAHSAPAKEITFSELINILFKHYISRLSKRQTEGTG